MESSIERNKRLIDEAQMQRAAYENKRRAEQRSDARWEIARVIVVVLTLGFLVGGLVGLLHEDMRVAGICGILGLTGMMTRFTLW